VKLKYFFLVTNLHLIVCRFT